MLIFHMISVIVSVGRMRKEGRSVDREKQTMLWDFFDFFWLFFETGGG